MFNNKRIEKIEKEVFREGPLSQRLDLIEGRIKKIETDVNGEITFPFVWRGHYLQQDKKHLNEQSLRTIIHRQHAEIKKLKDIVREVTDFVYRDEAVEDPQ